MEVIGYAASMLVLSTFYMKTMIPLRWCAIVSNVAFIAYGFFGEIYPVLVLHLLLLPLNIKRFGRPDSVRNTSPQVARERRHAKTVWAIRLFRRRRALRLGITRRGSPALVRGDLPPPRGTGRCGTVPGRPQR